MSWTAIAVEGALVIIAISIVLTFLRLLLGPTLPDRVISFDLLTIQVLGMICVLAIITEQPLLLDVAIILALLTFLATLAFARHMERTARSPERRQDRV